MSEQDKTSISPPRDIDPESAQSQGAELFAHGLMEFSANDTKLVQERRIQRLMTTLAGLDLHGRRMRTLRYAFSVAASLALLSAIGFFLAGSEPQAMALVEASLVAGQKAPVRRYEVRIAKDKVEELRGAAAATLDLGTDGDFLILAKTREGLDIAGGRGTEGEWAIHPNGDVETEDPRRWWPRWIFMADESLTGSPDELLTSVFRDYEATVTETVTIDGVRCRHIHAVRRESSRRDEDLPEHIRRGPPHRPAHRDRGGHGPDRESPHRPPSEAKERARTELDAGEGDQATGLPNDAPLVKELMREQSASPETTGSNEPARGRGRPPRGAGGPPGFGGPGGGPGGGGPDGGPNGGPGGRGRAGEPGGNGEVHGEKGGRRGGGPPPRNLMPQSIDIWIDQNSLQVRQLEVHWEGPRQALRGPIGGPPSSGPPSHLQFRLVDAPRVDSAWFESGTHEMKTKSDPTIETGPE